MNAGKVKSYFKVVGIIALAALIGFSTISCGGDSGGTEVVNNNLSAPAHLSLTPRSGLDGVTFIGDVNQDNRKTDAGGMFADAMGELLYELAIAEEFGYRANFPTTATGLDSATAAQGGTTIANFKLPYFTINNVNVPSGVVVDSVEVDRTYNTREFNLIDLRETDVVVDVRYSNYTPAGNTRQRTTWSNTPPHTYWRDWNGLVINGNSADTIRLRSPNGALNLYYNDWYKRDWAADGRFNWAIDSTFTSDSKVNRTYTLANFPVGYRYRIYTAPDTNGNQTISSVIDQYTITGEIRYEYADITNGRVINRLATGAGNTEVKQRWNYTDDYRGTIRVSLTIVENVMLTGAGKSVRVNSSGNLVDEDGNPVALEDVRSSEKQGARYRVTVTGRDNLYARSTYDKEEIAASYLEVYNGVRDTAIYLFDDAETLLAGFGVPDSALTNGVGVLKPWVETYFNF